MQKQKHKHQRTFRANSSLHETCSGHFSKIFISGASVPTSKAFARASSARLRHCRLDTVSDLLLWVAPSFCLSLNFFKEKTFLTPSFESDFFISLTLFTLLLRSLFVSPSPVEYCLYEFLSLSFREAIRSFLMLFLNDAPILCQIGNLFGFESSMLTPTFLMDRKLIGSELVVTMFGFVSCFLNKWEACPLTLAIASLFCRLLPSVWRFQSCSRPTILFS